MPRCKKGTRKNKTTGECESSTKNKTLSNYRINLIVEYEKKFSESAEKISVGSALTSAQLKQYKEFLLKLHFEKDVKLNKINDLGTALRKSIEHRGDFGQNM
jgi:hypothetical protein